jgi:hypothetical protein
MNSSGSASRMNRQKTATLSVALIVGFAAVSHGAEPPPDRGVTPKAPFDVRLRQPWASDNLQGTPEPPDPYSTQDAFPRLKFFEPLSVGVIPGSGRFGVATRPGKIYTFVNRPDVVKSDLLIDIGKTTYGVVFHPHFAENRYIYVTYVLSALKTEPSGSRLVRFQWRGHAEPTRRSGTTGRLQREASATPRAAAQARRLPGHA